MCKNFTKEQKENFIKLFNSGLNLTQISKLTKSNRVGISRFLKRIGYTINEGNRKLFCNFRYFKTIDTEDKAYWLGFIAADGNISKDRNCLSITSKYTDYNHLEKFTLYIKADNKVRLTSQVSKGKLCKIAVISIFNKDIKKDLFNHGIHPNKTKTLKWDDLIKNIPENLIRHFVRGYFDGDGCWYQYKNTMKFNIISASEFNFIERLQDWLIINCNLNKIKININQSKYKMLVYGGKNQVKRIYDVLYKDSNIYLERKFNKITNYLKY